VAGLLHLTQSSSTIIYIYIYMSGNTTSKFECLANRAPCSQPDDFFDPAQAILKLLHE